jgi:carbamoyltransferase
LVVAIEEERLSCEKHTQKFPINSINKCLQVAGLDISDIDHITVSIQPKKHLWSKVFYAMSLTTKASSFIEYEFLRIRSRNNDLLQWYKNISGKGKRPKLHYMDHHMSHIGGSYFVSPFNKAALLSVDGWGEWATSWLGYGEGLNLTHFRQSKFPHSLGAFYSACTEFCGFKPNYDEGKTMGLAPMGNPETFYSIIAKMVRISPDGDIELDLSFFDFQNFTGKFCSNKFYEVFGDPRGDGEDFADNHLDTAAAFQKVLEEKIIDLCNVLESKTETDCLVIAGGVALNSVVNGRLLRDTRFKNIYVMPGAGDNGTCIGAAYYLYNGILQNSKRAHHDNAFIGTEYPNDHIQTVLDECKLNYYKSAHVCKDTAKLLCKGKIVGKRQGNHIFFLARGCVMMRQPKTMKEDAHDKVTDRSIPFSQNPAALESPC